MPDDLGDKIPDSCGNSLVRLEAMQVKSISCYGCHVESKLFFHFLYSDQKFAEDS